MILLATIWDHRTRGDSIVLKAQLKYMFGIGNYLWVQEDSDGSI